jgi:WD40 repeat protein
MTIHKANLLTVKRLAQLLVWTLILVLLTPTHIQAGSSVTRIAKWNPRQDIIAATDGYTIKLYNPSFALIDQVVVVSDPNLDIETRGMEWSPDGSRLALVIYGISFDLTGTVVQIWDMTDLQLLTQIPNISFQPGIAWSPDSTQIAVVYASLLRDVVHIHDAQNGALLSEFFHTSEARNITQLAWSSDGSQIAFAERGYVQIWNAATQQYITTFPNRINDEIRLAYSPTDSRWAFIDLDNPTDILIWDTTTFQLVRRLQGHTKPIYTFTWGSGGIISVSFDDTTRVWDPDTGATKAVIPSGVTFMLSWNPDGTLFVTTDEAIGVYIRDAMTGDIVAVLGGGPPCTPTIEAGDMAGLSNAIATPTPTPSFG